MNKPVLHSYSMGENVVAFSTTRKGGVSDGNHGELNLNGFCGDDARKVLINRQMVAAELGIAAARVLIPHQVHGTDIRQIDETFLGLSEEAQMSCLDGIDGMMTNLRNVCIGVSTADCIPVLLYDPIHHASAAVHAGWRGTVTRIVEHAVAEMRRAFHTSPADLKAVVGPGISLKNFEVGQEVYDRFSQAGFDMGRIAVKNRKWHIDLPQCNRLQLMRCGVGESNIRMSPVCTYDHVDEYFSARRLGIDSGRIYTAILLK